MRISIFIIIYYHRELSYKSFRFKLENKLGLEPNALIQEKDKIKSIIEELSSSPTKRRNQQENLPRKVLFVYLLEVESKIYTFKTSYR